MDDVKTVPNETTRVPPTLSISDHDPITPKVFSEVIAQWFDAKLFKMKRLVIFHHFRIDGVVRECSEGPALECFAAERFVERSTALKVSFRAKCSHLRNEEIDTPYWIAVRIARWTVAAVLALADGVPGTSDNPLAYENSAQQQE